MPTVATGGHGHQQAAALHFRDAVSPAADNGI